MRYYFIIFCCVASFMTGRETTPPTIKIKPVIVERNIKVFQPLPHNKKIQAEINILASAIPERALRQ